jgi:hypothetical protein
MQRIFKNIETKLLGIQVLGRWILCSTVFVYIISNLVCCLCMAGIHCDFCRISHPRPVGRKCLFRSWHIDSAWACTMADDNPPVSVSASNEQEPPPVTINPPVTSVAIAPPPVTTSANLNNELPPLDEEITRGDVLNSTTHSERSNRSSRSVSEDVLLEIREMGSKMRAMNRNIALMLQAQLSDRERMNRLEGKNVSEQIINTSIGFTARPHIYNSNSYIVCTTQASPVYTTAGGTQCGSYFPI